MVFSWKALINCLYASYPTPNDTQTKLAACWWTQRSAQPHIFTTGVGGDQKRSSKFALHSPVHEKHNSKKMLMLLSVRVSFEAYFTVTKWAEISCRRLTVIERWSLCLKEASVDCYSEKGGEPRLPLSLCIRTVITARPQEPTVSGWICFNTSSFSSSSAVHWHAGKTKVFTIFRGRGNGIFQPGDKRHLNSKACCALVHLTSDFKHWLVSAVTRLSCCWPWVTSGNS